MGLHNCLLCYSSKHTEPSRVSTKMLSCTFRKLPSHHFFSCHFCYIFFFFSIGNLIQRLFFFGKSGKSIHTQSGTWTYKMLVNSNARFQLIWVHYHITNPFMIQEDNFDVYSMCSFLGVLIMKTYLFQCFMNKYFSNHDFHHKSS